jgi:hypothetical protein
MAIKTLKPAAPAPEKPDPMEFIEARSAPRSPEPTPEPEADTRKNKRFFVYMDVELLARIDRECKRRGIGRSVLLRQLAAEHLPE